jgi:anti-sigma B factor antagonist
MDIRSAAIGDTPLLEARGDIDHSTCAVLQAALDDLLERRHNVMFIDLHQVAYIDSGGLSVLLSAVRSLRGKGWLGVIAPNQNVRRLLEIVGLLVDPSFRLFDSKQAAYAVLAERQST